MSEGQLIFGISRAYINAYEAMYLAALIKGIQTVPAAQFGIPRGNDALCESEKWCSGYFEGDRRYRFLKGCIGAGDGTYVPIRFWHYVKARWLCRKSFPAFNVLAICRHDHTFSYALVGAEGALPDCSLITWGQVEKLIPGSL